MRLARRGEKKKPGKPAELVRVFAAYNQGINKSTYRGNAKQCNKPKKNIKPSNLWYLR